MSLWNGRNRWASIALLLIIGWVAVAAGCDGNKTEASEGGQAEARPAAGDGDGTANGEEAEKPDSPAAPSTEEGAVQAPRGDIYPGFNFFLLSPEQRTRFVAIAEAELCPCEDSTESLHACLQKVDRCGMATQVAGVIGTSIREGLNPTDTLDRVAKFVEESQKVYTFTYDEVPMKGSASAKVKIIEFADFQCPHCREAARVLEQIHEKYGDQVAIYFKQFPLGSPESQIAAQATLAAHKQGKFWPMHDLIFQNQTQVSGARIERYARQLGLNYDRFQADMRSPETMAIIQRDRQEGLAANISGTPAIFINGRTYLDDTSPGSLSRAIDGVLKESEKD